VLIETIFAFTQIIVESGCRHPNYLYSRHIDLGAAPALRVHLRRPRD
jgi:hypothetical protein